MLRKHLSVPLAHFVLLLPVTIIAIVVMLSATGNGGRAVSSCYARWWSFSGCGKDGVDCKPPPTQVGKEMYCDRACSFNFPPIYGGGAENAYSYAANSYLCPAGVHAGVVDPEAGGCMQYRIAEGREFYVVSDALKRNSNPSRGLGYFPFSLKILPCNSTQGGSARLVKNTDFKWIALAFFSMYLVCVNLSEQDDTKALLISIAIGVAYMQFFDPRDFKRSLIELPQMLVSIIGVSFAFWK